MPFDGSDFPVPPGPPRRSTASDNAVTLLIIALSLSALLLPVSMAGFADIVHYLEGR